MNSEKVKYFLSMSDKMNEDVFSVFSSGKKRISSEFSPFERSLSLRDCYLHLRDFCLLQDSYCSGFYPFGG